MPHFSELSGASRARPRTQDKTANPVYDESRQRSLVNRLSRVEGHVRSVKDMLESQRRPDEVLLQIAAIKAALNKFSATLLEYELEAILKSANVDPDDPRQTKVIETLTILLKQT